MTVTPVPLPQVRALLPARHVRKDVRDWLVSRPAGRLFLYSRGSYALASAVQAIRGKSREVPTVWLPAYFCDEAADPLRWDGIDIRYYEINANLEPDWERLAEGARDGSSSQVLVLVHYFGFPSNTRAAIDFCRRYDMTLVEDAAHVAAPGPSVGLAPFTVYSPRKLFAIPWVGCLVVIDAADAPAEPQQSEPRESRRWIVKRYVQKGLRRLRFPWHLLGRGFSSNGPARHERAVAPRSAWGCDPVAARWLADASTDVNVAIAVRRANYEYLLEEVANDGTAMPLFSSMPAEVCPYVLPLVFRADVTALAQRLQKRGIPVSRWPDLPVEVASNSDFPFSNDLYNRLLLLPVHQGLSTDDLRLVTREFRSALAVFR